MLVFDGYVYSDLDVYSVEEILGVVVVWVWFLCGSGYECEELLFVWDLERFGGGVCVL